MFNLSTKFSDRRTRSPNVMIGRGDGDAGNTVATCLKFCVDRMKKEGFFPKPRKILPNWRCNLLESLRLGEREYTIWLILVTACCCACASPA